MSNSAMDPAIEQSDSTFLLCIIILYPSIDIINIVRISYLVMSRLLKNSHFLKSHNQRLIGSQIAQEFVIDENLDLLSEENCVNGHEATKIVRMTVWIVLNSLLNNYSLERNEIATKSKAKKRKNKFNHDIIIIIIIIISFASKMQ